MIKAPILFKQANARGRTRRAAARPPPWCLDPQPGKLYPAEKGECQGMEGDQGASSRSSYWSNAQPYGSTLRGSALEPQADAFAARHVRQGPKRRCP